MLTSERSTAPMNLDKVNNGQVNAWSLRLIFNGKGLLFTVIAVISAALNKLGEVKLCLA